MQRIRLIKKDKDKEFWNRIVNKAVFIALDNGAILGEGTGAKAEKFINDSGNYIYKIDILYNGEHHIIGLDEEERECFGY